MKKTYIIPNTEVLLLSTQQMMASSPAEPGVTIGGDDESVEAGNVETRKHHGIGGGLWEDMK